MQINLKLKMTKNMRDIVTLLLIVVLYTDGCASIIKPLGEQEVESVKLTEMESTMLGSRLCSYLDQQYQVSQQDEAYAGRTEKLINLLRKTRFKDYSLKSYNKPDLDAVAFPGGCIRFWGGLFELLDDRELLFIVGIQAAHIELGHSARRLSLSLASLKRSESSFDLSLNQPESAVLAAALVKTPYSVQEEIAADGEALRILAGSSFEKDAAVSALSKMLQLREGHVGLFSDKDSLRRRLRELQENNDLVAAQDSAQTPVRPAAEDADFQLPEKDQWEAAFPETPVDDDWMDETQHSSAAQATGAPEVGPIKSAVLRMASAVPVTVVKQPKTKVSPTSLSKAGIPSGWYVQVAADSAQVDAVTRVNLLQSISFTAYIQTVSVGGKDYFRVLVGPYTARKLAEKDMPRIAEYKVAEGSPFIRRID